MFAAIKEQHEGVDVCIDNAGLAQVEPLLNGKTSAWNNMMDVNILALSICTREAYQSMKERNIVDGQILNINSMSGHRVVSHADTHFCTATKYAVTALTEGLRQELREIEYFSWCADKAVATCRRFKPLKDIDVAHSVIYILSAPPHVQIGDMQMQPVK